MLAGEVLKEMKTFVEEGVSSRVIVKGLRTAARLAENKIKEIAVTIDKTDQRDTLLKLASTAMSSKLIKRNSVFFADSEGPWKIDRDEGKLTSCSGCECGVLAGPGGA